MSRNKGQTEILGLVFVVILLVLGLLLLLVFVNKGSHSLQRFSESALAKSYLTTLAQTQTNCRQRTIDGLLQECAGGSGFSCDGVPACPYVQTVIGEIIDRTLVPWNRNYSLVVSTGESSVLQFGLVASEKHCPRDVEGAFYHIPYAGSIITLNLSLCS